jgi:hypothetical protein
MILVTMLAAIVLAGHLWQVNKTAPGQYASPFMCPIGVFVMGSSKSKDIIRKTPMT